jgi:hypothetical protein
VAYNPAIFLLHCFIVSLSLFAVGQIGNVWFQQETPAQTGFVSINYRSTVSAYLLVGNPAQCQFVARDVQTESFLDKMPIWDSMPKRALPE